MSADIALVTDALVSPGGAEKVFSVMCEAFPGADIYTSVYLPDRTLDVFRRFQVRELITSPSLRTEAQLKKWYPLAAWQMGRRPLGDYRVILSSSAHLARYVQKGRATHISYCYYPFRLLYEPERYPQVKGPSRVALRAALPVLRAWDRSRTRQVDRFIGISAASKAAIRKYYHRDADVIFSPILSLPDVFEPHPKGDFFLLVSRLEPWKNIEVVVDAFRSVDARLVIVGVGPEGDALRRRAGTNVEFAGSVGEEELVSLYRRARAVIHSARTEYGLTPIEANAYGTPAICWGVSGSLETMISYAADPDNATALFYDESTPEAIADAIRRFDTIRFDPAKCHANARRFGRQAFVSQIQAYVQAHG